jgi:hypothetical protein
MNTLFTRIGFVALGVGIAAGLYLWDWRHAVVGLLALFTGSVIDGIGKRGEVN